MRAPEEAMGSGPYLLIALPEALVDVLPVNATRLLEEWEATLDPTRALVETAQFLSAPMEWTLSDRFVEPGVLALERVRAAGRDEDVITRFGNSPVRLLLKPDLSEAPGTAVSRMIERNAERHDLLEIAMPMLLGLAVLAAVIEGYGYHGRQLFSATVEAWNAAATDNPV
jgi:hypothetical protein